MSNPQQPELARSRKTPAQDPDAAAAVVEGQQQLGSEGPRGPIPPENQPGHRPEHEQDKPDLNAFAERLGIASEDGSSPAEREAASERATEGQPPEPTSNRGPLVWAGAVATAITLLGLLLTKRRRSRRSRSRR